ncbi:hypothetical protein [Stutzerimonas zhaodongensis]|uniref:hypothetical protein n=1 Tax=Stutzerimonas zhaodongensis TaxID=1176257 RepID=UPI001F4E287B|nr:hypothetical protein [Stutzerimonas zhaodongensis]UNG19242.1 hypothetical protein MKP10_02985 [Stutzerimonas zhaodongensis]
MTYKYGMKGAPAVGGGLGGLPSSSAAAAAGGLVIDKEWNVKGTTNVAVDLGAPIERGRTFITVSAIDAGDGITGAFARLENFPVCRESYFYCAPKPGGVTNVAGFQVSAVGNTITVSALNSADTIHLRVFTVKNKIRSLQSVSLYRPASDTDVVLSQRIADPSKVFFGIYGQSNSTNGSNSFSGRLVGFADVAVSPFASDNNGAFYAGLVGFLDPQTVRLYATGGTTGGGSPMDIVEFE